MSVQVYKQSQDNSLVESEVEIRFTRNYELFKLDHRNRKIIPEHVDELIESIKVKNFLHLFPIIVDRAYTVLDGQHRLEAARALGTPIFYLVSNLISILDVPRTTAVVQKWSSSDYLNYHCAYNIPDYITIRELWKKYSFLRLSQVLQLAHSGDVKEIFPSFRMGTYKANSVPYCVMVAEAVQAFAKWDHIDFYAHSTFVGAIANLMSNKKYSHERLMAKMELQSRRLVKCPDTSSYIACLNEIYNYRCLAKQRVDLKKLGSGSDDFDRNRWNTQ